MRPEEWSGLIVPQLWWRDTRPLTFAEFVEEVSGWFDLPQPILDELDRQRPSDPFEQARATLYRDCRRRVRLGCVFAVCFAALDHLEAYRRQYVRESSERVLSVVSRILRDVVTGLCDSEGFVAQVGQGDFIFVVPNKQVQEVAVEVTSVFDALIPYQYDEPDRRAGYLIAKAGRAPLMTLSLGIVANESRHFKHFSQVAELGTEMLRYATALPGSVFVIDRRRDASPGSVNG